MVVGSVIGSEGAGEGVCEAPGAGREVTDARTVGDGALLVGVLLDLVEGLAEEGPTVVDRLVSVGKGVLGSIGGGSHDCSVGSMKGKTCSGFTGPPAKLTPTTPV